MVPGDENDIWRKPLKDELSRIEEAAKYSAQGQFASAKAWRALNNWLGGLISVLATVAGSAVLASPSLSVLSGVLSLTAAAIGALITTVSPSAKAELSAESGNNYLALQAKARQARLFLADHQNRDEASKSLKELSELQTATNNASPLISERRYKKAVASIEKGDQTYAVDESAK